MNSVTISSVVGLTPPFNVYCCDVYGNQCVFIGIVSVTPTTVTLPQQFDTAPAVGLLMSDSIGCERFEVLICNIPSPTPSSTPTETPTPTPTNTPTPTPTNTPTPTPTHNDTLLTFLVVNCCLNTLTRWVELPASTTIGAIIVTTDGECYIVDSIDPQTPDAIWLGITYVDCETCITDYPCNL